MFCIAKELLSIYCGRYNLIILEILQSIAKFPKIKESRKRMPDFTPTWTAKFKT